MLPGQILNVVQGNGPQGWLAAQSGFKHDLVGSGRSSEAGRQEEEEEEELGGGRRRRSLQGPRGLPAPPAAWPHLELFGAGHLHLAFQPLVLAVPARAPHGQLAPGAAQKHPQLALV